MPGQNFKQNRDPRSLFRVVAIGVSGVAAGIGLAAGIAAELNPRTVTHEPAADPVVFLPPAIGLTEREHCERLAAKYEAEVEVRLHDGSRVDLLTDEFAIEVDFARKHYEGASQAIFYSQMTGKRPALLLLIVKGEPLQEKALWRSRVVCARCGIRLFVEYIEEKK